MRRQDAFVGVIHSTKEMINMTTENRPAETDRDQQLTTRVELKSGGPTTTRSRGQWGKDPLRKSVVLLVATMLIAAVAAFTTPAAATEVKEAVKLCDQNPNCKSALPDSTGVRFFNVKTSEKMTFIACPPEGDCRVLMFDPEGDVTNEIGGVDSRALNCAPYCRKCSCARSPCNGQCGSWWFGTGGSTTGTTGTTGGVILRGVEGAPAPTEPK
jgi:hypothetical protein